MRRIRNNLNADWINLMLAGTTFVQSSGVPRVGLRASRVMGGAPLQAAAGQATTTAAKLSTYWTCNVFEVCIIIDTSNKDPSEMLILPDP